MDLISEGAARQRPFTLKISSKTRLGAFIVWAINLLLTVGTMENHHGPLTADRVLESVGKF
jgi:hypothetical protein